MSFLNKLLVAGIAGAVGAIVYEEYQRNKPTGKHEEHRRHKNRHLNPVFSKIKDLQSSTSELEHTTQ